ncbi:MAG: Methyltransferase type 11 [Bacteroidota bacterium]|jgi:phospholipid N-methyltransferase|nr:Methyltransferase type 11 [Bacteroidota bacterium]
MSLEKQVTDQYSKRIQTEKLYSGGYYVTKVTEELESSIFELLNKEFSDFKDLKFLEVGAGNGTNANMFLKFGFQLPNIYFNELLPERIKAIERNFPASKLFSGNAIEIDFDTKFDVVFQSTVFTSILKPEDRKLLADKMMNLLNPGGIILWYDFIYNNPRNKDVRKVDLNEIKELFPASSGVAYKKITLAPPIGRRVGRFYQLFNIPVLRSHILAVIRK